MKRKTISIILTLTLCLSLATPVFAEETVTHYASWGDNEAQLEITNVISIENDEIEVFPGSGYFAPCTTYFVSAPATVTYLNGSYFALQSISEEERINKFIYGLDTIPPTTGELVEDFYVSTGSVYHLDVGTYFTNTTEDFSAIFIVVGNPNPSSPIPDPTPPAPEPQTVNPTASTVYLNGEAKDFEAYLIGGANYFKLRDLAYVLNGTEKQFAVGYDNDTKAITLTSEQPYTPVGGEMVQGDGKPKNAIPTPSTIYLDGEVLDLVVYNIGGNNFFKLRDLMQAIDVYVGYDNATKAITLETNKSYT